MRPGGSSPRWLSRALGLEHTTLQVSTQGSSGRSEPSCRWHAAEQSRPSVLDSPMNCPFAAGDRRFKFCGACGAELDAAPAPAREERKVITVLFADSSASRPRGEARP